MPFCQFAGILPLTMSAIAGYPDATTLSPAQWDLGPVYWEVGFASVGNGRCIVASVIHRFKSGKWQRIDLSNTAGGASAVNSSQAVVLQNKLTGVNIDNFPAPTPTAYMLSQQLPAIDSTTQSMTNISGLPTRLSPVSIGHDVPRRMYTLTLSDGTLIAGAQTDNDNLILAVPGLASYAINTFGIVDPVSALCVPYGGTNYFYRNNVTPNKFSAYYFQDQFNIIPVISNQDVVFDAQGVAAGFQSQNYKATYGGFIFLIGSTNYLLSPDLTRWWILNPTGGGFQSGPSVGLGSFDENGIYYQFDTTQKPYYSLGALGSGLVGPPIIASRISRVNLPLPYIHCDCP